MELYSLELLENNSYYIQSVNQRLKHGAKGVLIWESYKHILETILKENQ